MNVNSIFMIHLNGIVLIKIYNHMIYITITIVGAKIYINNELNIYNLIPTIICRDVFYITRLFDCYI